MGSLPSAGVFRIERLLRPQSVAVIGAASAAGTQVLANLAAGGFSGRIFRDDEDGPGAVPDLAVIAAPAPAVGPALAALGAQRCPTAIVLGSAPDLAAQARASGVRLLGPDSFGVAVPSIGLNATKSHLPVPAGKLALVSQSSSLCRSVIDWAEPNGVGFSHVVGIGGNADIGFRVMLDWLSRDPGTAAILLDLHNLKDRTAFLSAARAAARLRPVVAIRGGGWLDDPSGLAGEAMEAALHRVGVLSVDSLGALLAAAETLTRAPPARQEALAIVTNAGGIGRLAADAALRDGLQLATLSPATRTALSLLIEDPPPVALLQTAADATIRLAEITAMLAAAPEVGGVLVVLAPAGPGDAAGVAALTACAAAIRIPVLVCVMGETTASIHRRQLAMAGLPVFAVAEQAVRGFLHLVQSGRNRAAARELPPRAVLDLAPDRDSVAARFSASRAVGRLDLQQDQALAVLSAYGIAAVPGEIATDPEAAVRAAESVGFPVIVTPRRRGLPQPGQAMFALQDGTAVRHAASSLSAPDGLLVQRQTAAAHTLMIRVAEDAMFGTMILFGGDDRGAVRLRSVAVDLPPLNLPLAKALVARSPVAAALGGLHDRPAADQAALAGALVRISQLVIDFPEIAALSVNPLLATADGVQAADAWICLHQATPGSAAPTTRHLALPPYPAELTCPFDAGGERLIIRPIRPEDAEAHAAFFHRLSPEDIRYRFFSAMRELSADQMARMTQVDYTREMAFVAVREATGETVGVSRLVHDGIEGSGEFAVIVQPDMKRRGLARHLMERLIGWARSRGMAEIVGLVLADNAPMLAFVRRLGFRIRHMPDEPDLVQATLTIGSGQWSVVSGQQKGSLTTDH